MNKIAPFPSTDTNTHHSYQSCLVAPVIIHCASGRRAVKAEQILKSKGYAKVYNAGGLSDMSMYK